MSEPRSEASSLAVAVILLQSIIDHYVPAQFLHAGEIEDARKLVYDYYNTGNTTGELTLEKAHKRTVLYLTDKEKK